MSEASHDPFDPEPAPSQRRRPGRAPGSPRPEGSGRKRGAYSPLNAPGSKAHALATREAIGDLPVRALLSIVEGQKQVDGYEMVMRDGKPTAQPRYTWPSLKARQRAAEKLLDKCLADKKEIVTDAEVHGDVRHTHQHEVKDASALALAHRFAYVMATTIGPAVRGELPAPADHDGATDAEYEETPDDDAGADDDAPDANAAQDHSAVGSPPATRSNGGSAPANGPTAPSGHNFLEKPRAEPDVPTVGPPGVLRSFGHGRWQIRYCATGETELLDRGVSISKNFDVLGQCAHAAELAAAAVEPTPHEGTEP